MATTSIWRVNGWLGKVLIYIENPDKTENPDFFEKQDMDGKEAQGLSDVIEYAVQQQKTGKTVESEGETVMRQFVSGVNCSPSTARDEMIAVKKRFGKEDGTVAYHGYQSFAPGEATPELAHEIGLALAKKLWGEKYQVLVATHLDRENHLHNHFVVNTVSFVDGIKYHRTEQDYFDMQRESDRLCREYGLSVIENPQRGKSKHYGEWRAEQEGRPTYLSLIKADVDTAIRQSMTERQFFYHLRQMGYDVKVGKDITVRPPNYPRGRKLMRNFGEDYSMENIRRRILAQRRPQREHRPEPFRCRLHGDLKQAKKVTGFRALYFHYCYLLGVFPQKPMLSAICSASGMAWTPKSMRFPNWTACFRGRSPGRIFLLPSPICGIRSNPSMAVWPGLWASPATASRRNRNGKGGVDPWKNRKKSSSPWTAMSMGS